MHTYTSIVFLKMYYRWDGSCVNKNTTYFNSNNRMNTLIFHSYFCIHLFQCFWNSKLYLPHRFNGTLCMLISVVNVQPHLYTRGSYFTDHTTIKESLIISKYALQVVQRQTGQFTLPYLLNMLFLCRLVS